VTLAVLVAGNNSLPGPLQPLQIARAHEGHSHAPAGGNGAADYKALLDSIDLRIQGLAKLADKRQGEWLIREHLAAVQLERANLSGSFSDMAQAEKTLNEALALAPQGSGPLLLAAKLNYSLHRLDAAEQYLDLLDARKLHKAKDGMASAVLRAELAFHRGDYDSALRGLHSVSAVLPAAVLMDLAIYHSKTAGTAEANALLEQAYAGIDASDGHGRAWVRLQQGILAMEAGDFELALKQMIAADKALPGWWLVREHIAEVNTLLGNDTAAVEIYREVIAQTGLPQYMDALAACYQRLGREQEAAALIAEAGKLWEAQIARYPEAAGGHGLEHFLEFGPASRALELARDNFAVRPGGEARVYLAQAYLLNEQPAQALEVLRPALDSVYDCADLHAAAAEAYSAIGKTEPAAAQRELALALNPMHYGPRQHVPAQWLARSK
jgi:Tfp pilus assembly protein PilF